MSGNGVVDQCPFCNAAWGDCLHVQLLVELDNEADARQNSRLPGRTSPASNVNDPAIKPAPAAKTDQDKTVSGSR